jgi:hypothetical protein
VVGNGKYVLLCPFVSKDKRGADLGIVNRKYDRLLAAADPENKASVKVLEKAGFVKAEYRKEFYERASQGGRKSDLQCFYLERPRASEVQVPLKKGAQKN